MAALIVADIAYLLAVREFFAVTKLPRHVVVVGLLLASIWHVEFLRLPAGTDDDVHRYVWDGRLQRLGKNPYLIIPSDPSVAGLHTPETRNLNNPELPSPYPPGAQIFFRAVSAVRETTFAMKVAFVLCDILILLLLLDILRRTAQPEHLALIFAWNPLLAIEVAGSGHIDIVGVTLLVASGAALVRRWRAVAAITFALAVSVKFLPIVLLPLYWKRVRLRDAALAVLVVGGTYVPFVNRGHIPTGSLETYVQSFRFNGPIFSALARVALPQMVAGLAVLVGLAIAMAMRRQFPELSVHHFAWPMSASLLCAPAVFPWYLLWLLPFLMSTTSFLLIAWTVCITPVYIQWHLRTLGKPWGALPGWVMWVEYGVLGATATFGIVRRFVQLTTEPEPLIDTLIPKYRYPIPADGHPNGVLNPAKEDFHDKHEVE